MSAMKLMKITVVGLLRDISFHKAKCCAEVSYNELTGNRCCSCVSNLLNIAHIHIFFQDLHGNDPSSFAEPEINGMLEFEWHLYVEEKKKVSSYGNVGMCLISEQSLFLTSWSAKRSYNTSEKMAALWF